MKLWITVPPEGKIDPRIWLAEISEPDRPPDQIDSRQVDFSQIPRGKTVFSAPTIATYSVDMAHLSVGELGELSVYQDSITELEIDYLEWDSLDFLRYFPNIRKAKINVRVKDIGALASLSHLRELSIMSLNGLSPRRLDCLGSLTSLETIYLKDWNREEVMSRSV